MPLFVAAIIGALVQAAGSIVGRVLISLGIGYATYTGIDASISWARDSFVSGMSVLPAAAIGLAGLLKVGAIVSMITSAITARMVLKGLTGGSLTRMIQK